MVAVTTRERYDLANVVVDEGYLGSFVSSPRDRLLRVFGRKKGGKKKRLIKDVLRVGTWCTGLDEYDEPTFWHVTPKDLKHLANRFNEHAMCGIRHNLCWGHGDPYTLETDDRDTIADLAQAAVIGDTLYTASWITDPDDYRDLKKVDRQVSVRVRRNWRDGRGKVWPGDSLLHVAVCDHPVMDGQGPFIDLSIEERIMPLGKRRRRNDRRRGQRSSFRDLQNEDEEGDDTGDGGDDGGDGADGGGTSESDNDLTEAIDASPPGTTVVPLDDTVKKINRLLPDGIDIPQDGPAAVTEQNFNEQLEIVVAIAEGTGAIPTEGEKEAEEDAIAAGGGGDVLLTDDGGDGSLDELPLSLSNRSKKRKGNSPIDRLTNLVEKGFKQLSNRMDKIEKAESEDDEADYTDAVRDLANRRVINGRQVRSLMKTGKATGWKMELLDGYYGDEDGDDGETRQLSMYDRKSRRRASNKPPASGRLTPRMTDEEANEKAKQLM